MSEKIETRLRKPVLSLVALGMSALALAGCSNDVAPPKVEGKVSAAKCADSKNVVAGSYKKSEINKIKAESKATQKAVCLGAVKIAQKALELYQAQESAPNDRVYTNGYATGDSMVLQTIIGKDEPQEKGATISFGLTKDGKPDMNNLERIDVWAREAVGDEQYTQQSAKVDLINPKTGWGLQNWSAVGNRPIAGQDWPFVDTSSDDLLGMRKNPSLKTLQQQKKTVNILLKTLEANVALAPEKSEANK